MEESEFIFRVPSNELFKKLLNLPEILIYKQYIHGAPETVYSNENEFTIKWPRKGSRNNNINRFKLIEKELNKKIIYDFEIHDLINYTDSTTEVINQNGRLTLLFEEIAPEEVILKIIVQIYEPSEGNLGLIWDLVLGLDYNYNLSNEPINYHYTFNNPVREVFELLLDLPSLLFATHEKTEDSNENEYTIKVKQLYSDESHIYKFKIIEKELNKKISYDYDFMESYVNLKGRLTLIFDEINPEKVNLKVYSKHNWLGESLNKKLKIQDIRKIFVKCKGKRFSVQDRSLVVKRGLTLELNNLNITDIEKEVEGLENFNDLTDLSLIGNDIKEITGLDKLVNLANLDLRFNKIEWISGLENLSNLQRLYLSENNIREIEGLENLTNLRILHLNNNKISKIRGMENLEKLQRFEIKNNLIPEDLINELGGYENPYPLPGPTLDRMRFPQRFVRYCRKSNIITEPEKRFEIKEKVLIAKLKEFAEVSQKIRLSMLRNALGLDKRTFDNKIFKWAKEFNFKIDGDFIIIEGDVLEFINSLDNKFKDWEKGSKKI